MDPRFIDDLARKLSQALPGGFRSLQEDLEGNFKAVLRGALGKLDLVTREEFEVQSAVLARTRERLKEFESRIAAMEAPRKGKAVRKNATKTTAARKSAGRKKAGKKSSG
ncbi:MAG: accessory factor UbiK family protein [Gammaproteobacteria bacterium]|nr:accessory factor UbiK family protein [Gammaproteobacteria bacterium]